MSDDIIVTAENEQVSIQLNGSGIADKIQSALPFESRASKWGDEIYFAVPVEASGEQPTNSVDVGDVAYWPEGNSLAIFYGPTPHSDGQQPVPPDDVEIVGTISRGLDRLDNIEAGESLRLSTQEQADTKS